MVIDSKLYSLRGGQKENEDSACGRTDENGALFVLADGLGGHRNGRLASDCVTASLMGAEPPPDGSAPADWLREKLKKANEELLALQQEFHSTMKSTVTALLIRDGRAVWTHIGDTRIYYFHKGSLTSVTEDDSVAYKKYKGGLIEKSDIAEDEDQSSLLRVLGNAERSEVRTVAEAELEPGDAFLLCSDGAWRYLSDNELLVDLLKSDSAEEWAELLLLRVIGRMTADSDNLSLIAVMLK